ncbi:hypothetical protein BA065_02715 [Nanoarchaeota archaeon NZ13-N]|nr:MAG: hypothetical protein BA065_02715 [Nanoarchaeota archaeon NZ13-N]
MSNLCLICRGTKLLCGKAYCPILVKSILKFKIKNITLKREVYGSSPPSVFVGRIGYPEVYIGPAAPSFLGNTEIYDKPEGWINKPLEEILDYRFSLIFGRTKVKVKDISNRTVEIIQEISMAERPVGIEMVLKNSPIPRIRFDEHTPPQGPTAPLSKISVTENIRVDKKIEKAYYDTDLKARNAIIELYRNKVDVSKIQKILSVGGLGLIKNRRLVPTRWAITAVDSTISENLIKEIKEFPTIEKYQVFIREYMKNLFIVILIPRSWSYEWMEGWFPNTTWNRSKEIDIEGDYEDFKGRTTYPSIGGCYYAARLATAEYLYRIKRQATAILIREIYPGFDLPIGVWFVRENLRETFKQKPLEFDNIKEVIEYVSKKTKIDFNEWIKRSYLLRKVISERKIKEWLK